MRLIETKVIATNLARMIYDLAVDKECDEFFSNLRFRHSVDGQWFIKRKFTKA